MLKKKLAYDKRNIIIFYTLLVQKHLIKIIRFDEFLANHPSLASFMLSLFKLLFYLKNFLFFSYSVHLNLKCFDFL